MRIFTVGSWTHDWDRLDIDNWPGGPQRDALAALVRESDALKQAKVDFQNSGMLTPDGIADKLRDRVRDRALPAIAKARDAVSLAANELAAVKAGLRDRLSKESTPRDDGLRSEQRAFLRSLPSADRMTRAFDPAYARAILEQPAEMSGINSEIYQIVENTFLEARFPGALEAARQVVASGEVIAQAAQGLNSYLREEKLVKVSIKGEVTPA